MRRRASSIGALSASTIAFFSSPTIRTSQHKGEILSGRTKDQCRGISDGGRHRLAGQLRLQLEAALEARRAT